jgi:hypothetical protein
MMRNCQTFNNIAGVVGLGLFLVGISPAAAQADSQFVPYRRLVMLLRDKTASDQSLSDLYSWAPGEDRLVHERTFADVGTPLMSPDGSHVVYRALPAAYVDALQRGEKPIGSGGHSPADIWLMDLTKPFQDPARHIHVADQITGLPTDSDGSDMQLRSQPVWSPDSTMVAWLELDYLRTAFSGRLVTYDLRNGTTRIVARGLSLGYADAGEWSVPDLLGWGSVIAYTAVDAGVYSDQIDSGFGTRLYLCDTHGRVSRVPISYFANTQDRLSEARWLFHGDAWRMGLYYPTLGWVVLDTTKGSYTLLKNPPFIGAITAKGWTGHRISADPPKIEWRNQAGFASPMGADELFTFPPDFFSPEGLPMWITRDGHLRTVEPGGVLSLPIDEQQEIVSVVWTPSLWMTDGQGTATEPSIVP